MIPTLSERIAAVATGLASAIVVIAIAIVPFLTPAWVAFEQGRSGAAALTGYTEPELRTATNAILRDLVLGPPEFDVAIDGTPVLDERERSHMRDVRAVFGGFAVIALGAAAVVVVGVAAARSLRHAERAWSAISTAMGMLVVVVLAAGVIAAVAFDAAFELFHQMFFAGGSYTFDPGSDKLVQLFPFTFWSETTIALGGVIVILAVVVAVTTRRLAGRAASRHAAASASAVSTLPAATEAGR